MRCKFCDTIIEEFIIILIIVNEVTTSYDNSWRPRKSQSFNPYHIKDYNNFQKPSTTETYRLQTTSTVDFTSSYLPTFQKVPAIIEVTPGQTAILSCVVTNLGDRMVSWIRSTDLQILTSGAIAFTADPRILSKHLHEGNTNWGLQIQNTRQTDSGNYECQINTEPKMKNNVTLIVREPQLMDFPYTGTMIDGPREQIVKNGTTVTFTCTSTYSSSNSIVNSNISTREIVWIKDSEVISYQASRGGINIYIEWGITSVKSTLTLAAVTPNDSGEYVCRTTDKNEDKISLVVVHGGKLDKSRNLPSTSVSCHSYFTYSYTSLIGFLLLNVFIIK